MARLSADRVDLLGRAGGGKSASSNKHDRNRRPSRFKRSTRKVRAAKGRAVANGDRGQP